MNTCVRFLSCTAVALAVFLSVVQAQQGHGSPYQELSDKFFDLLRNGQSSEAVDFLFQTNPELEKMTDDKEQLKAQFASIGKLMGAYVSHTKLVETKVAGIFVYQHYFVAYERQPISVRIKFYKPGLKWVCYALQFDAKTSDEIQRLSDERISVETTSN